MLTLKNTTIKNNILVESSEDLTLTIQDAKQLSKMLNINNLPHSKALDFLAKKAGYKNYHSAVSAQEKPYEPIDSMKDSDSNLNLKEFPLDGISSCFNQVVFTGHIDTGKELLLQCILLNKVKSSSMFIRSIETTDSNLHFLRLLDAKEVKITELSSVNVFPDVTKRTVSIVRDMLIAITKMNLQEMPKTFIEVLDREILAMVKVNKYNSDLTTLVDRLEKAWFEISFIQALEPFTDKTNSLYNLLHGFRSIRYDSSVVNLFIDIDDLHVNNIYKKALVSLVAMELSYVKEDSLLLLGRYEELSQDESSNILMTKLFIRFKKMNKSLWVSSLITGKESPSFANLVKYESGIQTQLKNNKGFKGQDQYSIEKAMKLTERTVDSVQAVCTKGSMFTFSASFKSDLFSLIARSHMEGIMDNFYKNASVYLKDNPEKITEFFK